MTILRNSLLHTIIGMTISTSAASADFITLNANLSMAKWEGDNDRANSDFNSNSGTTRDLEFSYNSDKYFLSLKFQSADYSFNATAPDQVSLNSHLSANNTDIDFNGWGFTFGYNKSRSLSFIAEFNGNSATWSRTNFKSDFDFFDFGIKLTQPVNDQWRISETITLGSAEVLSNNESVIGDGSTARIDIHAEYAINRQNTILLGFNYRIYSVDFNDGTEQTAAFNAFFVGYKHYLSIKS